MQHRLIERLMPASSRRRSWNFTLQAGQSGSYSVTRHVRFLPGALFIKDRLILPSLRETPNDKDQPMAITKNVLHASVDSAVYEAVREAAAVQRRPLSWVVGDWLRLGAEASDVDIPRQLAGAGN
jgi:hypothetical protein